MKAQRKEKPIKKAAMRPILNNIIGMFFLLFLTIGGAVYVQTTRQVKSQALETAQWVADKMNAAVSVQLQSVETQAQSIAAQVKAALAEGGQGADLVPIIDTLTAHLERSAELSSVAFVARAPLFSNRRVSLSPDSAGRFSFVIRKSGQNRTDFQAVGVNAYNNQVWWRSGLKANAPLSCAEHFISDDFGSKKQVKEIACPILHQGEAVGVLAFTLNLEQLGADAAGVASKNADVRVFAAAPNGTLFASANPAFIGQPYDSCFSGKLARNLTSLKTNGQPFSLKASADGRRGFWVAIPLPTEAGNGFIALSLPILTLFHAPIVVCLILFILIIMEFISIFLITNFFLTLISKLLAVLSRNALAIASGNNEAITDLSSVSRLKTAETAQLQQAFAQMLTNIQLKQKQILWLAEQDLSHEMEAASKEDSLGHSIQSLHAKLSAFFGELKTATNQVKTGTQQIADSAQNLSQATTEQASAVEEISASLLEISVQSKDNTTKTNETNQTMQQVTAAAHKGCDKMQTLLQVAQEISEASKQTETIVKAIDDIAFQTNLLALNANVEAARAGKYGRGFGVVAEEVRSLAKKSADSVIQTQAIITSMIDKINKSNQFIEETHDALNEILDFSDSVAKDMEAIKYANNEQNVGIEQITKAISQIEQVTQSNSAIAEEAAAATEELSAQAVEIEKTLTRIKMMPSDTPVVPLQPQPMPVRTQPMPEVKSTAPSAASVIKLDDDDFGNF